MVVSAVSHSLQRNHSKMALGPFQILLVLCLFGLLFSKGKISRVLGDIGAGISEFRKGIKDESKEI